MDKNYLLIQEYYSRSREQLIHHALKCQLELKDAEDGMRLISMHETEIWIQKSIAKLDEKNCKIYRMSMEEGKKVSEIADCLHIK